MAPFFLDYCLIKLLTRKTLREIYLAYSTRDPLQQVIIKIFDQTCFNQMQDESSAYARALLALKHPHIVPILDIGVGEQGQPYVVSEYRARGSLRQGLSRLSSGQMDWKEAINITMQVGQALIYLHQQHITHGNVKPENVFYDDAGRVQLADGSLEPFVDMTKLGYKSDLSTTRYMAPEQFVGKGDQQSDQYALACLVYELIAGHAPFEAKTFSGLWGKHTSEFAPSLSQYISTLPVPIDLAILKALAKKPEDRFPDITTFLATLASHIAAVSSATPPALFSLLGHSAASLSAGVDNPFFAELADRMLLTRSLPAVSETYSNSATSSTVDAWQSARMQSMHGRKTEEEPVLSDAQIIAEVSQASKKGKRRRKYLAVISILSIAILLLLVLAPSFFAMRPWRTTASDTVNLPGVGKPVGPGMIPTASATRQPSLNNRSRSSRTSTPTISAITTPVTQISPGATGTVLRPTPVGTPSTHSGGQQSTPSPPTATPQVHGTGSVQINVGGSGTGSFVADEYFTDMTSGRSSSMTDTSDLIDTSGVSNPAPQGVYQSSRIGDCLYTIPNLTPQALYTVRLHFAEIYWSQAGQRTFTVLINDQLALSDFDIVAAAGAADKAIVEAFVAPANPDGTITIQFMTVKSNALINGIEVLAA